MVKNCGKINVDTDGSNPKVSELRYGCVLLGLAGLCFARSYNVMKSEARQCKVR